MTKSMIAPSILSANPLNLQDDLDTAILGGADMFHIDIMDGMFVPHLTFGPDLVAAIRATTALPLDVHLMAEHPENYVPQLIQTRADLINLHVESTVHVYDLVQQIQAAGLKAGIVLNPATAVSSISPLLPLVDNVLVMTVNPGFGGQQFIVPMLSKIEELAQLKIKHPEFKYTLEVDGGINEQTIKSCQQAGASSFVAGSFIFDHDIVAQIKCLKQAIDCE
ncbi:ribulose-phosphate 3-epimerase [Bombilactobacillus folatiphilus]|uniref:Ribulose-phosphate 3-epimerase n=1 Tax=Bombilactobacillus folatiphilus TaxID=2923362 RepID=A0ABY4P7M9_9LACO|nr:ribulose-phosphate 3-epimerase [Bombilactobacillus folatiphilus]UQS81614.1 ribulose-phosphate 3-epimerase [Bombilactobacillus folatiphilus]